MILAMSAQRQRTTMMIIITIRMTVMLMKAMMVLMV